jgi:hypothetical protein
MNALPQFLIVAAVAVLPEFVNGATLSATAVNKLAFARPSQTIELTAAQLEPLGAKELTTVHVRDSAGNELVCQAVDTDYDTYHKPDLVIFQADFAAGETRTFTVATGKAQEYDKAQFRAFGRFVRERFDDFAWENDRVAHRAYGQALETWEGEPLCSSTIDIWSKRTPRMVINDWYLADNYHEDSGEGADFYSAGLSRGCGGSGLWAGDRLWTSRNFIKSRVLANGPIRVMFELEYAPFEVGGISVTETKRVTLDAGSQLNHFRSSYKQYTRPGQRSQLTAGIGLRKAAGEQLESNTGQGWLLKWEKMAKDAGNQGLAVIVDSRQWEKTTSDELNQLVLVRAGEDDVVSYWAGFAWDKAGQITGAAAWKQYVDEFAQGAASPIEVKVTLQNR